MPSSDTAHRSPFRRIVRGLLLAVAGLYAFWTLALVYVRFLPPATTMVQAQRRIEAASEPGRYTKRQRWRPLDRIPRHVHRAVVAAEDTRFWEHRGFDWKAVEEAVEDAQEGGGPRRGASTITQQLVKNLFFTTHRSMLRKGLELTLTPLAEAILGKRRILELYMNVVEWGPGVYGIEAAAQHHYGVPASRLTREQAARLAAVLPAPLRREPERMTAYSGIILQRMQTMGW